MLSGQQLIINSQLKPAFGSVREMILGLLHSGFSNCIRCGKQKIKEPEDDWDFESGSNINRNRKVQNKT